MLFRRRITEFLRSTLTCPTARVWRDRSCYLQLNSLSAV
uniref:Uncharacterized protein n=2 Tax=Anguilla anguilla TaxID=7936 RepID=A0A0E9SF85_ANGAN